MTGAAHPPAARRGAGAAAAVLLFAVVAVYLARLPWYLSIPDEGHALTAAKRLLDGEAMYRDIFDLSTPGWPYLMAGVFAVFGTTLAAARTTASVIHAAVAVGIYLACRQLAVRRGIAWAAGILYVATCMPMFAVASYHWLATLLCVALLLLCLRGLDSVAQAAIAGVVAGLLIAVHQQRGAFMGIGVAAILVFERLLQRVYERPPPAPLGRRLAALAGGVLAIVVPMLAGLVARAGWAPVWDALIVFPLVSYRTAHRATQWGFEWYPPKGSTSWRALYFRSLPLLGAAAAVALVAAVARRGDEKRARALLVLVVFAVSSIVSIMYYPDIIHIAFIAPVFLILAATGIERGLQRLPAAAARPLGAGLAAAAVIACAGGMDRYAAQLQARYPVRYASAFGPLDLANHRHARIIHQLRAALDRVPARTLFAFPMSYYTYLVADARNPTRHAFVVPNSPYTPDAYLEEIVGVLGSTPVPYVYVDQPLGSDKVSRYIEAHYERLDAPHPLSSVVWRRKAEAGPLTTAEDGQ